MKSTKELFVVSVLLLALSLTGCGQQETTSTFEPTATAYAYPPPMYDPDEVAASLTAVPDEEAVPPTEKAPEPDPTDEVAAEPQVDHCVACHSDQQALIDTADPIAKIVSENEGEG